MKKSSANDRVRLLHMLDAAQKAFEFSAGLTRTVFERDHLRQFALARAVEIIGEAVNNITDDFQAKHPQIAWAEIKSMRHRLAHAYFDINLDILWVAIQDELPPLVEELQKIVPADDEL